MKNTGIVRRIDDLGRIVIPKEIRRTLRIGEGDFLEIYVGDDKEIIFKKHSSIKDILDFADNYIYCLQKYIDSPIIIFDTDNVLISYGKYKKELINLEIKKSLILALRKKTILKSDSIMDNYFELSENLEDYLGEFIIPILSSGDLIGGICCFSKHNLDLCSENLIKVAADFIGKQLE